MVDRGPPPSTTGTDSAAPNISLLGWSVLNSFPNPEKPQIPFPSLYVLPLPESPTNGQGQYAVLGGDSLTHRSAAESHPVPWESATHLFPGPCSTGQRDPGLLLHSLLKDSSVLPSGRVTKLIERVRKSFLWECKFSRHLCEDVAQGSLGRVVLCVHHHRKQQAVPPGAPAVSALAPTPARPRTSMWPCHLGNKQTNPDFSNTYGIEREEGERERRREGGRKRKRKREGERRGGRGSRRGELCKCLEGKPIVWPGNGSPVQLLATGARGVGRSSPTTSKTESREEEASSQGHGALHPRTAQPQRGRLPLLTQAQVRRPRRLGPPWAELATAFRSKAPCNLA